VGELDTAANRTPVSNMPIVIAEARKSTVRLLDLGDERFAAQTT
jgi:hypothetical protein